MAVKIPRYWLFIFSCSLAVDAFQGYTNNFGNPAIRELIHIFFFSRENRIGNLRPSEFGTRIPNNTLTLAVTAVSLFLV